MKKITFIILFLVCAFPSYMLDAQTKEDRFREKFPYKYEFRVGLAGYPLIDDMNYGYSFDLWYPVSNLPNLDEMYSPKLGSAYMTGIIFAEFSAHFKRWFSLSVMAGFNGLRGQIYNPADMDEIKYCSGVVFTLLPEARFYWVNARNVRLYSSAGLGLSVGGFAGDCDIYPAFQVSPVGITLGRKVFFFAEYNFGTSFLGGKFGLGYRF